MNTNREYKSSVFSLLFGEEQAFRKLYEAIAGVKLPPDTPVVMNTLEVALFRERLNDLSAVLGGKVVVIIEHQSTINPNMPLRLLSYIARLYEKITVGKRSLLYGRREQRIPSPEIIVLYNGADVFPDYAELRLSDLFEDASSLGMVKKLPPDVELTAHVYNINAGHNERLLQKDATLGGYAVFIDKVREFEAELLGGRKPRDLAKEELAEIKKAAMEKAVKWCIAHDELKEFLETNSTEVINMLFDEWKLEDALVVEREEGREEGREKHAAEILHLIDSGYSLDDLKRTLTASTGAGL
jgi:hypothetical protein